MTKVLKIILNKTLHTCSEKNNLYKTITCSADSVCKLEPLALTPKSSKSIERKLLGGCQ